MRLEDIGFYTLSDERARNTSATSDLQRCELILTGRCNFRCPYCRLVGGSDLSFQEALRIVRLWCNQGLKNVRFSGGEPTLWPGLRNLVEYCQWRGVGRIAISTNGSATAGTYGELLHAGVNDFSISLDACCAEDGDHMAGGRKGSFSKVVDNIRMLSQLTYVTVGVVLTPDNRDTCISIIEFADTLGVSDIRVIPAAQSGEQLPQLDLDGRLLEKYSILRYRASRTQSIRGNPRPKCRLVLDDMAVMKGEHYPCIIYMREGGAPIGKVNESMRADREQWCNSHDCTTDPICAGNCLDVCVEYNRKAE